MQAVAVHPPDLVGADRRHQSRAVETPVGPQRDDFEGGGVLWREAIQPGAERVVGRDPSAAKVAVEPETGGSGDGFFLEGPVEPPRADRAGGALALRPRLVKR